MVAATAVYQVKFGPNLCLYVEVTMSALLVFATVVKPQAAPQSVPVLPGIGMPVVVELCCPGSPVAANACAQPKLMLSAGVNCWVRNAQVPFRVRSFWN